MSGHGLIGHSHPEPAPAPQPEAPAAAVPERTPAAGDLVHWRNGTTGVIAPAVDWLDPGEVLVWRSVDATGIADHVRVIPVTDLTACGDGFTYTGSLG